MKKLIVSALMALSCGVLFAEDMYLCWMIDPAPIFDVAPGDYSKYTAKITSDGESYLELYYEDNGDLVSLGKETSIGNVQGWDTLAFLGSGSASSFFVELYNADEKVYTSDPLSSNIGAYISSMKGMDRPADTYGFKNFTAVPEPTSGLLLLLGVAGLALRRKNKKA